jgi:hypothetical protein
VLNGSEIVSASTDLTERGSTDRFVLCVSKGLDRRSLVRELVSRSNSRPHMGIV